MLLREGGTSGFKRRYQRQAFDGIQYFHGGCLSYDGSFGNWGGGLTARLAGWAAGRGLGYGWGHVGEGLLGGTGSGSASGSGTGSAAWGGCGSGRSSNNSWCSNNSSNNGRALGRGFTSAWGQGLLVENLINQVLLAQSLEVAHIELLGNFFEVRQQSVL